MSSLTESVGLLFVGHGTRNETGTREFLSLVEQASCLAPHVAIEPCFLELRQPDVAAGWHRLLARGVTRIRLVPVLLWAAGHALRDLPKLADGLSQRSGVSYEQSAVLGFHPEVLARSETISRECLKGLEDWDAAATALVLVGRGSTEDQATADMIRFGELRSADGMTSTVEVGFVAMALPSLGQILDQLGRDAGVRDVVVQPHLLFNGELNCTICKMVRRAAWRYPSKRWTMTDLLGPDPHIVRALLSRSGLIV